MLTGFWPVLCALLIAHALCDYPLQGDFLARAKDPCAGIRGVPWIWPMAAHCGIHAGAVWAITGSGWCAILEFGLHLVFDAAKCCGELSFSGDQVAHVLCKVCYAIGGLL